MTTILKTFKDLEPSVITDLFKLKTNCLTLTPKFKYSKIYTAPEYVKCICCGTNKKESIEHLLFECNEFVQRRCMYIKQVYRTPRETINKLLKNTKTCNRIF